VVATEVRQLAQRCGEAAGQIKVLISLSHQQTHTTVARVQASSQALKTVVDGVRQVATRLAGVAQNSSEQSQGLKALMGAVGSLDEITRQNGALVDESTQAADALVTRAALLAQAVVSVRLRQGSADEAQALVQRALRLLQSLGLAAAKATLHSTADGFVDRDLYVFLVDREGRYVLHGAKPALEGQRVHELPGIDGDRFVQDAWAAAKAGGGWVEYQIVNPRSGQVQPKASWVVAYDKNCVMGCGIYRSVPAAVQSAAALAPRPAPATHATRSAATPAQRQTISA
jgi:hypothetical protein